MRAEDLDPGRSKPAFLEGQLSDLRWLGLDWDEGPDVGGGAGPYLQSLRHPLYESALATLRSKGLLFDCFCSRKEIAAAASAPQGADDDGPPYPGTCSALDTASAQERRSRGPAATRMRVAAGEVCFVDGVMGSCCFEPAVDTGAFVVRRKDGVAAYQLAVVVDDHLMGITDVLRGADLLSSTARQILLYRALGWEPPRWAHVPLLLGPDGERLAKRHGAVSLRELREGGGDAGTDRGLAGDFVRAASVRARGDAGLAHPRLRPGKAPDDTDDAVSPVNPANAGIHWSARVCVEWSGRAPGKLTS